MSIIILIVSAINLLCTAILYFLIRQSTQSIIQAITLSRYSVSTQWDIPDAPATAGNNGDTEIKQGSKNEVIVNQILNPKVSVWGKEL